MSPEDRSDRKHRPSLHDGSIPTRLSNLDVTTLRSFHDKETELGTDYVLQPKDVLIGTRGVRDISTGTAGVAHPGNERFRILVEMRLERYKQAYSRTEKTQIVSEVVDAVRASGGRFVKREAEDDSSDGGCYYDVGNSRAREKVGHTLRSALNRLEHQREGRQRWRSSSSSQPLPERAKTGNLRQGSVGSTSSEPSGAGSSGARLDFSTKDIFPDPIVDSTSASPSKPDGFHEFIRSTFLSDSLESRLTSVETIGLPEEDQEKLSGSCPPRPKDSHESRKPPAG